MLLNCFKSAPRTMIETYANRGVAGGFDHDSHQIKLHLNIYGFIVSTMFYMHDLEALLVPHFLDRLTLTD